MTLGFGNQYSIQLSYGRILKVVEGAHSNPEFFERFDESFARPLFSNDQQERIVQTDKSTLSG